MTIKFVHVNNLAELSSLPAQSLVLGTKALIDLDKSIYEYQGPVLRWVSTGEYSIESVKEPVLALKPTERTSDTPLNANTILDYKTIHQPVVNVAALSAIPTGGLTIGDLCMVVADSTLRQWKGPTPGWVIVGTYLIVADGATRTVLTSTQVNNGQLVSQLSDQTIWLATVSGVTVTWNQIGGPGSFDPFDAIVDSVGGQNGHYISETAAIVAGKAVIFTVAGSSDTPLIFNTAVEDTTALLSLPTNELQIGTLCLVVELKEYMYWNGSVWLSREQAPDIHPFAKLDDNAIINISRNTIIYRGGATYHLSNQTGFNIPANLTLEICSVAYFNTSASVVGATLLTSNSGGTNFFTGSGAVRLTGINFIQGGGSLFAPTITSFTSGCQAQTLGNNSNFFNLGAKGSDIKDVQLIGSAIGANPDNAAIIGAGCTGDNIYYFNQTGSTGIHITVQSGGKLLRAQGAAQTGGGGLTFKILNQGYLEMGPTTYPISPVIVNDGGTVANCAVTKATGFAAADATLTNINTGCRINNVIFNDVIISNDATAANTCYLESSMTGGTYSDLGTNTLGFANTGGLPNSVIFLTVADATARLALTSTQVKNGQVVTQDSDKTAWIAIVSGVVVSWAPISGVPGVNLSPYNGAVDGAGVLPYHYLNFGAAYAAGKTEDYSIANVIETANIDLEAAGQIFAQIGQTFTWDLSTYSIVGSFAEDTTGANSLTVEFTDASSVLKWGNSTDGLPFSNFDNLSTVVINARGGVLQNISTDPNCYLYCAGTLILKDAIVLLPNASNGGIKTTPYTQISGIELTGGGLSCDTALTCEGGSIRDAIIDGTFTDNSILIKTNEDTAFDAINVNVGINGTIEIMGKASKIFSSNATGFLIVQAKTSVDPNGSTSISDSNFDQLSTATGTVGIQVSNCTIGVLDLPSDNTVQIDFVNCTILNSCSLYGDLKFTNCHFPAGFTPETGSTLGFTNSTSGEVITFGVGVTTYRSANEPNIGNDSPSSINADTITSGTLSNARLSNAVVLNTVAGVEQQLASSPGVDLNVVTKTNLYTVPASRSCVITKVIIRNASTSLTTTSFGVGFNANANDVVAASSHLELTGNTVYSILSPIPGAALGNTTDVFGLKCLVAQGAPATATIETYGYLI